MIFDNSINNYVMSRRVWHTRRLADGCSREAEFVGDEVVEEEHFYSLLAMPCLSEYSGRRLG